MKRRLWIAAAVWVAFWSLYPALGRPRAIAAVVQRCSREQQMDCGGPEGQAQMDCFHAATERMHRNLDAITLRSEYAGFAPVWFGVGVCVPLAGALMLMRRRRLA